jgi:hypothetical protein
LGRRHKPSHRAVNWTIVIVAGLVTLCIGVTFVLLNPSGGSGRLVVPPGTTAPAPPAAVKSSDPNAGRP